jgi:gas vesicle protein
MSTLPEQFSAARKAQVEQQLDYARQFGARFVEQSTAALRQLFSAKDQRDLLALTNQTQASFDSLLAYSRELLSIATGAQGTLLKTVTSAPLALSAPEVAESAHEFVAEATHAVEDIQESATQALSESVDVASEVAEQTEEAFAHNVETAQKATEEVTHEVSANLAPDFAKEAEKEVEEELHVAADAIAVPSAHLTPVAEAIHEASEPVVAALAAAPVAFDTQVTITGLTPVDAAPPPVSAPVSHGAEKLELNPGKSRKKK